VPADELQKYAGIAPVTERSVKKSWVHWRWQCPTFVRQKFVEWAGQTIKKSFWAGAYYRQQRNKGIPQGVKLPAHSGEAGVRTLPEYEREPSHQPTFFLNSRGS
jgi:transposase IS116/IS110/IS902 family protein